MDHRATSIQFLRSTGLIPVKVRPRQKDPFSDYEPRTIAQQDHAMVLRQIENDPELNIGGLFFGKYVDLDIDTDDPFLMHALDHFLPKTPWVWGRPSKPRSHRAYVLHEDFERDVYGPIARYLKALKLDGKSYSVELRGGRPENGLFAVLPGSYRADVDETVEWSQGVDTSVSAAHVPGFVLVKQLRLAAACAIICNYWGDGVRNDLSLALSGTLWRIRSSSLIAGGFDHESDVPEGDFILTEDDAEALFEAVLKIADPNKSDRRARVLNFQNTWAKLDNDPGAKVTGGKVMAELIGGEVGQKVVRTLYRLLSDNDGVEALEQLAEQYVVWNGPGVLIDLNMVKRGRTVPWMTKEQAGNSLGHKKVIIADKKIPIVNLLFGAITKRVEGVTFDPGTNDQLVDTDEGLMVNQWRGLAVEPCEQRVSDSEVSHFLDYVKHVLANGNEEAYKWILSWVADLFQDPSGKPGTTLVLIGVQGAGKTFLGEQVIGKIIGKGHYTQMNSISQLTDKFNSIADNKVFIQCDEAIHSYQRDIAAKLKSLISDETMTIEPKGINSFKKPNHIHFLFTSNEKNNPIFIDPSPYERRFTVQEVSSRYAKDQEYWTHMRAWTDLNLHKILRWLLDYKYDKETVRRPIHSAAKRDIQRQGIDAEVSWIVNRLAEGFPLSIKHHDHWWQAFNDGDITQSDQTNDTKRRDVWPNLVSVPALEADFKAFVREHGRSIYSGSINTLITKVFPEGSLTPAGQRTVSQMDGKTGQTVKQRVRLHHFPTAEAINEYLREKMGDIIEMLAEDQELGSVEPVEEEVREF